MKFKISLRTFKGLNYYLLTSCFNTFEILIVFLPKHLEVKIKQLIIVVLIISAPILVKSQVNKDLQIAWEKFDYPKYLKKYNQLKLTSLDEKELTSRVLYKVNKFEQALALIKEVEQERTPSKNIQILKDDIVELLSYQSGNKLFEISPVDFNSDFAEFTCAYKDSFLYYSTNKTKNLIINTQDIQTELPYLNLKKVEISDTISKILTHKSYSTKMYNDGPIAFYKNESALTLNYPNQNNKNLKLVFQKDGGDITEFEYNNPSYSVGHATYSVTGDTLIFVSDMDNKNGITDLYFCTRSESGWTKPIALPSNINTSGNEMFPNLVGDELYFSSNGLGGYGLLDIYKVKWLVDNAEPVLLPFPINTNADDFGIVFKNENTKGYFTSNRKGTDDIYYFNQSKVTFGCKSACENEPCIQLEIEDFTHFDDSRFEFIWNFGDGEEGEGSYVTHCYKKTGKYIVNLSFRDKLTGEFKQGVMTNTVEVKSLVKNLPSFEMKDTLEIGEVYEIKDASELNSGERTLSAWEIEGEILEVNFPIIKFSKPGYKKVTRNVKVGDSSCCYQSFYDYVYVKPSETKLEEEIIADTVKNLGDIVVIEDLLPVRVIVKDENGNILTNYPLKITDKNSTVYYEEVLDTDTLKLMLDLGKEYLVSAQTSVGNLVPTLLSAEGKTENDFLFIYKVEDLNLPKYIVQTIDGDLNPLSKVVINRLDSTLATTNKGGFYTFYGKPNFKVTFSKYLYFDAVEDLAEMEDGDTLKVILTKVEADAIIRLDDIYFDLNKWHIRPDAAEELNKLVKLMKEYPTLEIELRAHTDARGTASSNMTLSDKRAKSAASYIVSKGIDTSRLQGQGYGETLLLNECKDGVRCSEEKHQWNRRVECKIIKI